MENEPPALFSMKTFGTVLCPKYSVFNFNFIDKSYTLVFIKLLDFVVCLFVCLSFLRCWGI